MGNQTLIVFQFIFGVKDINLPIVSNFLNSILKGGLIAPPIAPLFGSGGL